MTTNKKGKYYRCMDPKSAQTLDPKLKEAYDRVMGTSLPTPSTPPVTAAPPQIVTPHPSAPTPVISHHEQFDPMSAKESAHETQPAQHTAATPPQAATHPAVAAAFTAGNTSGFVAPHEEKKPAVSGTLLIIAGVVFFIVYTLFCMKLFGVEIPFLP